MIKSIFSTLIIILIPFIISGQANAQTTSKLETAIEAWLDDNDRVAIPLLGELARAGEVDAMLLLGQLDGRFLSPYLMSLTRKERNKLFRAGVSFFGTFWQRRMYKKGLVNELLKHNEKAKAANIIINNYTDNILFNEYHDNKHLESSRFALWVNAYTYKNVTKKYEKLTPIEEKNINISLKDAFKAVDNNEFQGLLFIYRISPSIIRKHQLWSKMILGSVLDSGAADDVFIDIRIDKDGNYYTVEPKQHTFNEDYYNKAFEMFSNTIATQPLVGFCERKCPQDIKSCTFRFYDALRGYEGLLLLQSPIEKVISSKRYFSSKRFEAELLRNVRNPGSFERLRRLTGKTDSCVKRLVENQP